MRVQIRNEVGGSRSSVRVDGGTVARMVALVSCFSGLPDRAPPLLVCSSKFVRAVGCGRAFRAIIELIATSGRNRDKAPCFRCESGEQPDEAYQVE